MRQQNVSDVDIAKDRALDLDIEIMPRQMLAEIGARDLLLLAAFIRNNDDLDAFRLLQQRHRIANSACGGAAAVPANHNLIELERVFLNVRDDNDRASGFKQ